MSGLQRMGLGWILAGLAMVSSGCTSQDQDCLIGISRKVAQKGEHLVSEKDSKVAASLIEMRGNLDQLAVDARVQARLAWDSTLAGSAIEVRTSGSQVELKGTVRDGLQKQRALDLARSTVGVHEVIDSLNIVAVEPKS